MGGTWYSEDVELALSSKANLIYSVNRHTINNGRLFTLLINKASKSCANKLL